MKTLEEVMQREVFSVDDIAVIFNVCKDKAYEIIRGIRSYSDRLGMNGKCHRKDYEDWLNRFNKGGDR